MYEDKNFKASKLLLEDIWYAKHSINNILQEIDWKTIRNNENKILRSSSEEVLIKLAYDIYNESRINMTPNDIGKLDITNQDKVLKVLKIFLTPNHSSPKTVKMKLTTIDEIKDYIRDVSPDGNINSAWSEGFLAGMHASEGKLDTKGYNELFEWIKQH